MNIINQGCQKNTAFHSVRYALFALLILITSGCVSPPKTSTEWQTHQAALTAIESYTTKGRMAYRSPEQRASASVYWQQQPEQTQLRLTSFVGKTILAVNKTPATITVTDINGQQHVGHDLNALTWQLSGMRLPVEQLEDWLLGLPTGADNIEFNTEQRLASLTKTIDGQRWLLTYDAYHYQYSPALPAKMTLTSGEQKVIIQLNSWEWQ